MWQYVRTTIHNVVIFVHAHFQLMLMDSYPSLDMPRPPASTHNLHTCPQQPQSLSPICKRAVSSAMFAMDHILNMLARPLKWDSLPLGIDNWGACTPLRPLALECELCNHPEKAFIQLLLSDIRQGHNIGYT